MSDFQHATFHRFGAVSVRLSVELGRTEMPLRDVLKLGEGSTVTLDRLTDELLDVTANGRVIARGEVVADKGRFALRIVSLVDEDGQDVPASGGVRADMPHTPTTRAEDAGAAAAAASTQELPGEPEPGPDATEAPAPGAPPAPPPVDPLMSALDDFL